MKKKILLDIYLAKNLGDDLFLDLFSKRYPYTEITVNHPGNDIDSLLKNYNNVQKFPYSIFDKALRRSFVYDKLTDYKKMAKDYDAMIFLGGGIFREESYEEELFEYRKSIVDSFVKLKKPVFFLGCNFGPFKTQGFVDKHKKLFEKCTDVCFRDMASYNLFKKIPSVRYAPDLVWSLDEKCFLSKSIEQLKKVGISIIDPRHKDGLDKYLNTYLAANIELITEYCKLGYQAQLFSFCESEGDLEIARKIWYSIDPEFKNFVTLVDYQNNLDESINEIASCEVFYAARFHAIILAMLKEIPVVPIIYNIKTKFLLQDIGFQNKIINFDNLQELTPLDLKNYIFPKIDSFRIEGIDHFKVLSKLL